ncbi:MAG: hypothetical protein BWY66_00446 [bacterium ADurb.Bin374]|nr:MAG: hypothetical protein BWY66_00446 [bacterium ADurb.Bin374]
MTASSAKPGPDPHSEAFVGSILREVDASLGIVKNDESFDLSTAQFWYKAAFQKEIEGLFSEKTRLKVLIEGLKARKFSEEDIHNLFGRIRKARAEMFQEAQDVEEARKKLKLKVAAIVGVIVLVFLLLVFFSVKRQQEEEKAATALAKAKIIRWDSAKNISRRRSKTDAGFSVIPLRQPEMFEGDLVQTTSGENTIPFADGARLTVHPDSQFRVISVEVAPPDLHQTLVRLELEKGSFSWKKPETSSMRWQLAFPGGELRVKWGQGTLRVDGGKRRATILEGENYLSRPGKLDVPLNGLMEAVFDGNAPEVIQMVE